MEQIYENLLKDDEMVIRGMGEIAYDIIKKNIVAGCLKPGVRLIESRLANTLKISRTPLREAIHKLEHEGWVMRLPSGGVKVTDISAKELHNIISVRILLEGLMAREAASKNNLTIRNTLKDILAEGSKYAEIGDSKQVVAAGVKFHKAITDFSENHICIDFLNTINELLDRYRVLGLIDNPVRGSESIQEHTEIFQAIASGHTELAEQLMQMHIQQSWKAISDKIIRMTGLSKA